MVAELCTFCRIVFTRTGTQVVSPGLMVPTSGSGRKPLIVVKALPIRFIGHLNDQVIRSGRTNGRGSNGLLFPCQC